MQHNNISNQNQYFSKLPVHKLMLYLGLVGITVLFVVLTLCYLFSKPNWHWEQYPFPKVFFVSTLALLAGSYTINKALSAFKQSQSKRFKQLLVATLLLSLLFTAGQALGWLNLYQSGIYIAGKPDGSYLYIISGLHVLHVLAGILWLLFTLIKAQIADQKADQQLLYYTQPNVLIGLEMLAIYWHFVDILWVYLLLFFMFNNY
jgi:cytochrome c oxidase subunit 3